MGTKKTETEVKTKKGVATRVTKKPIAYTITDKYFGSFDVKNSANAWWLDIEKVKQLIAAFKFDASITEACVYAGIDRNAFNYFIEKHPEFSTILEHIRELPNLSARKRIVEQIPNDTDTARWYLERKRRGEFGVKPELALPPGELHLHLHKDEKIMQIINKAEEDIRNQIEEGIKVGSKDKEKEKKK
jgi:hypothetical protein